MPHRKASHYEEIQMKRYTGQFTGWNPGYIAFVPDTADVDTINRIRGGRAAPIDMRGHMKNCGRRWPPIAVLQPRCKRTLDRVALICYNYVVGLREAI